MIRVLGHASAQASGQVAQTVYSRNALANLERLYICLAGNNPDAALRAIRVTRDKIAILSRFPGSDGSIWSNPATANC